MELLLKYEGHHIPRVWARLHGMRMGRNVWVFRLPHPDALQGVMDQLALIALGQSAGFSLDDIRSMFLPSGEPNIDRQLLSAKADELDTMVKRLKAMSNGLRHAAACPAESHAQCPSFQRLLKAAADGALERQQRRSAQPVVGPRRPRA